MTPLAPLHYRLEPHDLAGHRCRVTLTVATPDPAGQVVSLPAWIPGSYLMREFARQIETLVATDPDGRDLVVRKRDRNTWQVAPSAGPIQITTVVYCHDLSVRGAHLDDTHGFFNGTSVFLRAHGHEQSPCLLTLTAPDPDATATRQPWRVHTSLPEARGHADAAMRHGFGAYLAPDYDALLDHPIEMGTPAIITFEAFGAQHEMVFTGQVHNLDLDRLAHDTRRICETQIAFFEPETRRAPFLDSSDRYVFMTQVTADGYGGLEHRASTALITSRRDLPVVGQNTQTEGYRTFLGLVSHEYFHTWHVKRIKPAAFAPYDLSQENHTRLLWVFEGFTSYYDDLLLLRAGVIDLPAYLQILGKTISQVHRSAGRHKQSVADSSFDAWTRYYRQDENSPNALVSYYTKGALVALGLDLLIRTQTHDRQGLDDVMRQLWCRYGRDFYQGQPTGLAEDGLAALIKTTTGVEVQDFLARYVDGTADVPLATLLAGAGFTLTWQPDGTLPVNVDWRVRAQGDMTLIATVHEGGNAHAAGLSPGDTLVALDGLRVSSTNLDSLLQRHAPGDVVIVHVFRGDQLREFALTLDPPRAHAACVARVQQPLTT